jgi:DNA polymerase-3 subunit delta
MSSSKDSERPDAALSPVVLIEGPSASLRDAALSVLREQVLAGAPRDFNEDRFDFSVSGTEPAAVVAAARTLPMMARARLVLVRGLGEKRAQKFTDGALVEYLEAPLETTCLVLEAASVDKRQRWVKRVAKIGRVIDCTGPSRPADVRRWIEARLAERGARAGSGVAAALFDLVGADLDRLSLELEKLCLYAGEKGQIDADMVDELVGQLRPRALYELTDAIGERRLTNALRVVAELTEQGEAPLVLVGALANHFRRLLRAREVRPLEAGELQKRLGLHPFAAQKIVDQVRRFDGRRLRSCLDAVRRTDEALKGGLPIAPRLRVTAGARQRARSTSERASRGVKPCARRSSCAGRPCSKPCAAVARRSSTGPACRLSPRPRHRAACERRRVRSCGLGYSGYAASATGRDVSWPSDG